MELVIIAAAIIIVIGQRRWDRCQTRINPTRHLRQKNQQQQKQYEAHRINPRFRGLECPAPLFDQDDALAGNLFPRTIGGITQKGPDL